MFLFITTVYTPSVRFLASFTAGKANQAGWLAPFVSLFFLLILFHLLHSFYSKYKKSSFMAITYDILGKYPGKILVSSYIIWLTILLALYVRYYGERLASSILPNMNMNFFVILMLAFVAFVLRWGIVYLARMNELIVPHVTVTFLIILLLVLPDLEINKLTPISYLDIIPVVKASIGTTGIWIYAMFVFMIGDKIIDKENIKKAGWLTSIFVFAMSSLLLIVSIGSLGYRIIQRTPLTFYSTVKQVVVFEAVERFEALLITTWVLTDFVLIAIFTYVILKMLESLVNVSDTKHFINIFMVFLFLLSMFLAKNVFELQAFSSQLAIYINVIFGFLIPVLVFAIGKIRGKV